MTEKKINTMNGNLMAAIASCTKKKKKMIIFEIPSTLTHGSIKLAFACLDEHASRKYASTCSSVSMIILPTFIADM